jgi:hypothetical protein
MSQVQPYRLGFRWVRSAATGSGTPPIQEKLVATTNTLAVFTGDAVQLLTANSVYPCTRGGGSYPTPSFVVAGCSQYLGADSVVHKGSYLPAATVYTGGIDLNSKVASKLLCIPVTGQIFACTFPTAAADAATAAALVGKCIDLNPGAGSTSTGLSGHLGYTGTDATYGWQATTVAGQMRLEEIPQYGLDGKFNDPTVANWTGYISFVETLVTV